MKRRTVCGLLLVVFGCAGVLPATEALRSPSARASREADGAASPKAGDESASTRSEAVEFQRAVRTARTGEDTRARGDAWNYLLENHYTNRTVQALIAKRLDDQAASFQDRATIIKWMLLNNERPSPEAVATLRRVAGDRWRTISERRPALEYLVSKVAADPDLTALCRTVIDQKWRYPIERRQAAQYLIKHSGADVLRALRARYPEEKWREKEEVADVMNATTDVP